MPFSEACCTPNRLEYLIYTSNRLQRPFIENQLLWMSLIEVESLLRHVIFILVSFTDYEIERRRLITACLVRLTFYIRFPFVGFLY